MAPLAGKELIASGTPPPPSAALGGEICGVLFEAGMAQCGRKWPLPLPRADARVRLGQVRATVQEVVQALW